MTGVAGEYVSIEAWRDLDGMRFRVEGLERVRRVDVQALRTEQELLPGDLVEWTVRDHARPWQSGVANAKVPPRGAMTTDIAPLN